MPTLHLSDYTYKYINSKNSSYLQSSHILRALADEVLYIQVHVVLHVRMYVAVEVAQQIVGLAVAMYRIVGDVDEDVALGRLVRGDELEPWEDHERDLVVAQVDRDVVRDEL